MIGSVALAGRRITVRDWRLDDLPGFAHWLQPEHRWHELDGPYYPKPSAETISDMIARRRVAIENGDLSDPRASLVIADGKSDDMIGQVTWYWESEETNWLSVGVGIYDPDLWGKGLGYEALGLWSDYLFQALPSLARLDLRTWSGNHSMMRLAEKLGYVEEARFRKARIVNGVYYDGMGYGVLREEWDAHYPGGFAAHLLGE